MYFWCDCTSILFSSFHRSCASFVSSVSILWRFSSALYFDLYLFSIADSSSACFSSSTFTFSANVRSSDRFSWSSSSYLIFSAFSCTVAWSVISFSLSRNSISFSRIWCSLFWFSSSTCWCSSSIVALRDSRSVLWMSTSSWNSKANVPSFCLPPGAFVGAFAPPAAPTAPVVVAVAAAVAPTAAVAPAAPPVAALLPLLLGLLAMTSADVNCDPSYSEMTTQPFASAE